MLLVVFGLGDDARDDDGLGPLLLARAARAAWRDVTTVEDFQLQIEHALDLDGAEAALFVDAGKDTPAPFRFAEIGPKRGESDTTHALAPEAVPDVYARSFQQKRPCGKYPPIKRNNNAGYSSTVDLAKIREARRRRRINTPPLVALANLNHNLRSAARGIKRRSATVGSRIAFLPLYRFDA